MARMQLHAPAARALRKALGVELSELARVAGCTPSHMSNVLAGRRTLDEQQIRSVSSLLGGDVNAITIPATKAAVA
jgi:transcriptional regulator with XRE-family HTH domain